MQKRGVRGRTERAVKLLQILQITQSYPASSGERPSRKYLIPTHLSVIAPNDIHRNS